MIDTNAKRGSHKLLAALNQKGANVTAQDIGAALSLPADSSFTARRYFPRGVLPFYELEATLFGPVAQLGAAVNQLAANDSLRGIKIFIHGIVAPDTAEINVQLAGRTD